jgi:hypothetical protein
VAAVARTSPSAVAWLQLQELWAILMLLLLVAAHCGWVVLANGIYRVPWGWVLLMMVQEYLWKDLGVSQELAGFTVQLRLLQQLLLLLGRLGTVV